MNKIIFGGVLLILLAAGSIWAAPQYPLYYSCVCIDKGWGCEGGESIELTVRNNKSIKFKIMNDDGRVYSILDALRDVTQPSKRGTEFKRFYHNNKKFTKIYPHLFVDMAIIRGSKLGYLEIPEYKNSEYDRTWEYDCEKQKPNY